ncbi:MAG: hypothetical protein ACRDRU_15475 [Pseudonocardiaceae bacterium]
MIRSSAPKRQRKPTTIVSLPQAYHDGGDYSVPLPRSKEPFHHPDRETGIRAHLLLFTRRLKTSELGTSTPCGRTTMITLFPMPFEADAVVNEERLDVFSPSTGHHARVVSISVSFTFVHEHPPTIARLLRRTSWTVPTGDGQTTGVLKIGRSTVRPRPWPHP